MLPACTYLVGGASLASWFEKTTPGIAGFYGVPAVAYEARTGWIAVCPIPASLEVAVHGKETAGINRWDGK